MECVRGVVVNMCVGVNSKMKTVIIKFIKNMNEYLPREDEVCVEFHAAVYRNVGKYEMRMLRPAIV